MLFEYAVFGISGSKFVVFRLKTGGNTHCFRRFTFITSYVRTITAKSRCKIVMHGHPKVELSNIFHLKQFHGTSGPSKSINVPYQGVKYTFFYYLCQILNPQLGVLMTCIIMLLCIKTDGHIAHDDYNHNQGTSCTPGPRNMPNQGGKIHHNRHFCNILASALLQLCYLIRTNFRADKFSRTSSARK